MDMKGLIDTKTITSDMLDEEKIQILRENRKRYTKMLQILKSRPDKILIEALEDQISWTDHLIGKYSDT